MNRQADETRSIVVERDIAHPPERIWRALTQPHLLEAWLARMDFRPVVGHRFGLRMDPQPGRTFLFDCEVLAVEPNRVLSYTWNSSGDDPDGLKSAVTWTLTPTDVGTRLRMEQSGFRPDQKQAFGGAKAGWQQFFANLEQVLARTG